MTDKQWEEVEVHAGMEWTPFVGLMVAALGGCLCMFKEHDGFSWWSRTVFTLLAMSPSTLIVVHILICRRWVREGRKSVERRLDKGGG